MGSDAVMVLTSNAEIMSSIESFYTQLVADEDFPHAEPIQCQKCVRIFASHMNELIYDPNMHVERAKVLVKVAADRKTVASQIPKKNNIPDLSNDFRLIIPPQLIQHLQAQAAARRKDFAATMWRQAERSGTEAIAMRM